MGLILPLKYKKSGAAAIALQEFEPGDTFTPDWIDTFTCRNKFINGTLNFFQRGVNFSVSGTGAGYYSDRWLFNYAAVNLQVVRLSLNVGEIDQLINCMRVVVSGYGSGTSGVNMRQPIELVHTLNGKDAVVSFWARAGATGQTITVRGQQVFGTGGSANVGLNGGGTVNLSTSWERYAVKISVPSALGKTYGANNNLQIIFDFNGNGTYDIAGFDCSEGSVLLPFEYPSFADEIPRVQRYYEKSYDLGITPGSASAFGRCGEFLATTRSGATAWLVKFATRKRSASTIAIYASETGAVNNVSQDNGTNVALNGISSVGETGFQISYTNSAGRYGASFHFTADSEF